MAAGLEVRSALPPAPRANGRPPLLFVHGAYCDAWFWEVNLLPWFAAHGYAAHALSLRGHGKSAGRERLDETTLADYVDDIRAVARELETPPVLVGHSMGAALVERLIGEEPFPGAALVCPIPPSGLLPVITRLWWGRPDFFLHAQTVHRGLMDPLSLSTLREFYFTSRAPVAVLAEAMHHLNPESSQAVMELTWRGNGIHGRRNDVPVCVIAAAQDALFTPDDVEATASRLGTTAIVLDGLPHMLMLEPGWEQLAEALDGWMRELAASA